MKIITKKYRKSMIYFSKHGVKLKLFKFAPEMWILRIGYLEHLEVKFFEI